jgi:hypothetical protein
MIPEESLQKGDDLRISSFQALEEAGDGEGDSISSAECERTSYPMGCA